MSVQSEFDGISANVDERNETVCGYCEVCGDMGGGVRTAANATSNSVTKKIIESERNIGLSNAIEKKKMNNFQRKLIFVLFR